jgi:hypothetical protein
MLIQRLHVVNVTLYIFVRYSEEFFRCRHRFTANLKNSRQATFVCPTNYKVLNQIGSRRIFRKQATTTS